MEVYIQQKRFFPKGMLTLCTTCSSLNTVMHISLMSYAHSHRHYSLGSITHSHCRADVITTLCKVHVSGHLFTVYMHHVLLKYM